MARLSPRHRPGVDLIYPMAQRLVDECLASDGSLFTPGVPVWSLPVLGDFRQRFVEAPSAAGQSFMSQFETHLTGASAATVQLAAEMVYVYLLVVSPAVISPDKKREIVRTVLGWTDRPVSMPPETDRALDAGLLKPGQYYSSQRHRQISWLTRFFLHWKARPAEERTSVLADPWRFRAVVEGTAAPRDGAEPQRRALLHLVHPDTFEAILSKAHVRAILRAFAETVPPSGDPDRDLLRIRDVLGPVHGDDFDFYRSGVHDLWRSALEGPAGAHEPEDPAGGEAADEAEEADAPDAPKSLAALADSLHLDVAFLTEVLELLEDKRQIVFYGPPGTGKTFVARALAHHLGASTDSVEIVQFHPSYSYEDFVEGYRPVRGGGFDVVWGPLRRLAGKAEENPGVAHVLVIDELNRGNVAKVFGELYYLLEYRSDPITLQYSAEPFRLPENLWVIGTMNTADRSIALLDSALRRRFYFVELSPARPPVSGVLRRWLHETGKADLVWVADVVERANELLGDRHAAIGPSHFMRPELDEGWVERIWQHAVEPYLAEHFFGEEHRLGDFALDRLRAAVSAPPPPPPPAVAVPPLAAVVPAPAAPSTASTTGRTRTTYDRRLDNLADGITVTFRGARATVKAGKLVLEDGRSFDSPSPAAQVLAGYPVNGWQNWMVEDATIERNGSATQATMAEVHDLPADIVWAEGS